jgi:lipopolysaccharide export system protein LptA
MTSKQLKHPIDQALTMINQKKHALGGTMINVINAISSSSKFIKTALSYAVFGLSLSASMQLMAESSDRDQPIDLEADSMVVDDAKQTSTYKGRVILKQGTLVIHADKLVVHEDKFGFQHSTSTGNPTTFKQKRDGKNEYMEGSDDIVKGDYIMYDAVAEVAEVKGGTKSATNKSGRVRAVIQPKKRAK